MHWFRNIWNSRYGCSSIRLRLTPVPNMTRQWKRHKYTCHEMLSQATTRTCMLFSVSGFSKSLLRVYGRRKCAGTSQMHVWTHTCVSGWHWSDLLFCEYQKAQDDQSLKMFETMSVKRMDCEAFRFSGISISKYMVDQLNITFEVMCRHGHVI